jgi:beta-N-acetylhexosaminidase
MSELARDVGQLLWVGFEGHDVPDELAARIAASEAGGVILFRRNVRDLAQVRELCARLHAAAPAGAPILLSVDQDGGRVQRLRAPATEWPPMLRFGERLAAAGDDAAARARVLDLAERVGLALGREVAAAGFDVDFAPVLDVHTNEANPVIGDRSFARDPEAVALLAGRFAAGLAAAGVLACGKHFPGHGDTHLDSHLALPRVDHPLERLRKVELAPFARLAKTLPTLMTAHVVFSAVDAELPATLSPRVLTDVLRGELGYTGLVVSDDLEMKAIADHYGVEDAVVRGLLAGCDVFLLCHRAELQRQAFTALVDAAERRSDVRRRVEESVARQRALKAEHAANAARRADPKCIGSEAHQALARALGAPIDDAAAWTI